MADKSYEIILTRTEEEINMWSVLIAVLKNWGKKYDDIDHILPDICDIKEFIKTSYVSR